MSHFNKETDSCHNHDILTYQKSISKTGTGKPISLSDASDMQFCTEVFWYKFLITNRTCSIFVLVYYGTSFLVRVSGADFWYVCHGHNSQPDNQSSGSVHRAVQQYDDWYTGCWWVDCYIWYIGEGPGRATVPPRSLLDAVNVAAHPSTARVPTSYYSMWHC